MPGLTVAQQQQLSKLPEPSERPVHESMRDLPAIRSGAITPIESAIDELVSGGREGPIHYSSELCGVGAGSGIGVRVSLSSSPDRVELQFGTGPKDLADSLEKLQAETTSQTIRTLGFTGLKEIAPEDASHWDEVPERVSIELPAHAAKRVVRSLEEYADGISEYTEPSERELYQALFLTHVKQLGFILNSDPIEAERVLESRQLNWARAAVSGSGIRFIDRTQETSPEEPVHGAKEYKALA